MATRGSKNKPKEVLIEGMTLGEIKKARNLFGTWRFFGYETKEEFDAADISDRRMVVEYLRPAGERKAEERTAKTEEAVAALERYEAESESVVDIEARVKEFERKVEERVAQYLEDFEATAKTDIDNLRNLASAQIRLEVIQETRAHQMAKPIEQQMNKAVRDVYKTLGDEEKSLLQQVRLLQKGMGLDKPTREAADSAETGVDRVQAIVEAAKKFMVNEVVQVHHCGIRIGDWADYFWETGLYLRKRCPRCGEMIVIEYPENVEDSFQDAVKGIANVVSAKES